MSRASVTLTRETKLLLTALALLAVLGGWLVWNNAHQAQPDQTVAAAPAAAPKTVGSAKSRAAASKSTGTTQENDTTPPVVSSSEQASDSTAVPISPAKSKTDVVKAPPFPMTDPNGSTPDPAAPPPPPSGINPNQPLSTLNGHNPFRPIRLDAAASGPTATGPALGSSSADQATSPVAIRRPNSSPSQIDGALAGGPGTANTGGAFPSPQIPTVPERTAPGGAVSTGGALPLPTIPGTQATAPGAEPSAEAGHKTAGHKTAGHLGAARPTGTSAPGQGTNPRQSTNSGRSTNPGQSAGAPHPAPEAGNHPPRSSRTPIGESTPQAPAPTRPPVTGVSVPNVTLGSGAVTAPTEGPAASGALAKAPGAAPQVITKLGQDNQGVSSAVSAAAGPDTSDLDSVISGRQLVFDAAVLGPVNTAIFRSNQGYVVATVGQPIPNTNIILRDVTATSATLVSGQTTKTLQLDQTQR